jgi:DNA-binding NarL/FixJ family response regulator
MEKLKKATVIIADADVQFADSLETILNLGNYQVIDKIPNKKKIVACIPELEPDIIIVDYNLSIEVEGDLVVEIRRKYPLQKLLMLTYYANLDVFEFCMEHSVNGFQPKDCSTEELFDSLDIIMDGGFALPMPHKTEAEVNAERPPMLNAMGRRLKLTLREMQIIKYLVDGHTNKEIASILYRTEPAIDDYCVGILEKVGLTQVSQLIAFGANTLF